MVVQLLPVRAVTTVFERAAALSAASASRAAAALQTLGAAASAGFELAAVPVRMGTEILAGQTSTAALTRHCWGGDGRAWIEVRGRDSAEHPRRVLEAVQNRSGVTSVRLNGPLSRLVVDFDAEQITLQDLCAVVDEAEQCSPHVIGSGAGNGAGRVAPLPGDGLLLAARGAMLGVNAAALGLALAGRALRLPRASIAVNAVSSIANYQPWLRGVLDDRIGARATDTVLSLTSTAANIVTLSPASLSVELLMQTLQALECRAQAQAWVRHEPRLARDADHPDVVQSSRPAAPPEGPVERHAKRAALLQLVGAGLVGALTRNLTAASTAAVVAAPKAMRATCEAFAATLGAGLAGQHGVLVLRPESLRRLDKVDVLLIDPRALCGERQQVVRVRGAADHELSAAWGLAQALLDEPGLSAGWHPVPGLPAATSEREGVVEALIMPAHHPFASALMAQARRSGPELVTVGLDILGELRPAFDDIRPVDDGAVDDALAAAVTDLQRAGHTVAVLSSAGAQALSAADVALGLISDTAGGTPWHADLMLTDLASAWHVLHALPAARQASQRGIALSNSASALGALFLVPGVRGAQGPGPVTAGAAAGLVSGYLLARRTLRTSAPSPAPAYEWHAMSVQQVREVLSAADSDTPAQAAVAHRLEGASAGAPNRLWQFLNAARAELLEDPLTPVLAVCSAATAVLGSPTDAVLVGTVLTGNAMLATAQQMQAENRLNRLLAQQTPPARTVISLPDGTCTYGEVLAGHLLPGDVIEVRSNEVVPADARLVDEQDLEVDESSLTGESLSVAKQIAATPGAELADRRCMLYAGTTVVAGTAVAIVTAVGADSQERRAAELASGDVPVVGLHHQLSQLMSRAFPASAAGGALAGAVGMLRGGGLLQALSNAIAIAVAAVPEGMPLMATLAQHASAQRLGKTGALVRVPRSVEALGRVDVVCFDKTGTLSQNRLRVARIQPVPGQSGEEVLRCAAHAAPANNGSPHAHATDNAIVQAAAAVDGALPEAEPVAHVPFRSGRAFSASASDGELTVKGAPEVVLAACGDIDPDIHDTVAELAAQGLRVIAVAHRQLTAHEMQSLHDDADHIMGLCDSGLSLTGFLGLSDTPRPQAAPLLAGLGERGVGIRLITGDHPVTATAIAAELGVPVRAEQVITGSEWNALTRKEQERVVCDRVIFARMSPENKVQIVQTLERAGSVCAMVGDGANDAAAIRAATVGIGVVAHGSDAAHTVAEVVLTEGRIETLLDAIDEGRRLWRGVQAAVAGLVGGNAGEVIFAVIGSALTGNSPLNARQLLLMNMLTDALPATAVAVSTPAGPAQRTVHGIDEKALWRAVGVRGAITAAAATAAWAMAGCTGRPQRASTVALITLVSVELGQTLLDSHAPLVVLTAAGSFAVFAALITTPGISQLLGCTPVGPLGWTQALTATAAAIAAVAATHRLRGDHAGTAVPLDATSNAQTPDPSPTSAPYPEATQTAAVPTLPVLKFIAPQERLVSG